MKKEKKVSYCPVRKFLVSNRGKRVFLISLAILICVSGLFFARHVRATVPAEDQQINFEKHIDMGTKKIINLGTPEEDADAVTKGYLDGAFSPGGTSVIWDCDTKDVDGNCVEGANSVYLIDNTWNVGIGTDNPQAKFDVYDTNTGGSLARVKTDGYIEVDGGIIPMMPGTGNIGTSANRWEDINITGTLYDNGTIYYINPSDSGTSAVFAGDITVDGTVDSKDIATNAAMLNETETVLSIWAFNGGVTGSTAPFTVDSTYKVANLNADLLDGYHLSTTRNLADTIPVRDANGYLQLGWINTTSGDNGTTAISRIYASQDGYIRYYTPANFATVMKSSFDEHFVLNTGDSMSGPLTMSGSSANIVLGSNYLSGDGGDEGVFVDSSGNVGIGVTSPGYKLDVNGSIRGGGRARVETNRSIGATVGNTVAIGYFSNEGVGNNIVIRLKAHNSGTIDVTTFEIDMNTYVGDTTDWLEIPLKSGTAYAGGVDHAIDVYRQNIASTTDPLYVRVRNKQGGGAGTVQLVIDYDDDSTLTELTSASTTATAFNASTAPAAGAVSGIKGNAEWHFPVSSGNGWGIGTYGIFIKNDGNVGIGTTSPGAKLDVAGQIRVGAYGGNDNAVPKSYVDGLGGGDVYGPSSATDNAIARFNGTTGKLIQNSGITIDDSNNLTTSGYLRGDNGIYVGDDEYFWSDSEDRIATTDDFYVQAGSNNTYLYSTNTYLGASSGDNIRVRDNKMYGDDWIINYNEAGNWGIGTTSPQAKLHVQGDAIITGGLDLSAADISANTVTASIFYDKDNVSYYIDPASTSNFNALNVVNLFESDNLGVIYHTDNLLNGQESRDVRFTFPTQVATTTGSFGSYILSWNNRAGNTSYLLQIGKEYNNYFDISMKKLSGDLDAGYDVVVHTTTNLELLFKLNISTATHQSGNASFTVTEVEQASESRRPAIVAENRAVGWTYPSLPDQYLGGGNVGINDATPSYKLDVNGTGRFTGDLTVGGGDIYIDDTSTKLEQGDNYDMLRVTTPGGYFDIGASGSSWAELRTGSSNFYFNKGIRVDTGQIGSYNEDLSLQTSGTTRMTINNSSGNVGIGTTSPSQKLEVNGSIQVGEGSNAEVLIGHDEGAGGESGLIDPSNDKSIAVKLDDGSGYQYGAMTGDSTGIFINSSGNVGIGTTGPIGKLDIRGDEVRIWDGTATVNYATGQGDLYVEDDLEVDDSIYALSGKASITSNGINLSNLQQGYHALYAEAGTPIIDFYLEDEQGGALYNLLMGDYDQETNGAFLKISQNPTYEGIMLHSKDKIEIGDVEGVGLAFTVEASASKIYAMGGNVGIGTTSPSLFKLQVAGHIGPNADSTYDLGTNLVRWGNVYADSFIGDGSGLTGISASDVKVAVDASATADYIGATASAGVLRSSSPISYIDGGDYITLGITPNSIGNTQLAYDTGQTLTTSSSPNFTNLDIVSGNDNGIRFWNGSSDYMISMGNDQADKGWVTDYSIHMNMGTTDNRGFTWGYSDTAVTASLEAETGNFWTDGEMYIGGAATVIGKLTAGEIDPPYNIDGTIYATYGHSTTGLKEETTGKLRLQETRNKKQETKLYSAIIDFDNLEVASDLWLFKEITAFGDDWNDLVVSLTPEGKADVWYEFISEENKLTIYGERGQSEAGTGTFGASPHDSPLMVSYRLVAPRFDWPERDTNLYNQTGKAPKGVGIFVR